MNVLVYNALADVVFTLWNGVIQVCQNLLASQLSWQASLQGVQFCSKRSLPLHIDGWKWNWLSQFLCTHRNEKNCRFVQCGRKCIVLCHCCVHVYPVNFDLEWIQCKTEFQLRAVNLLFGSC